MNDEEFSHLALRITFKGAFSTYTISSSACYNILSCRFVQKTADGYALKPNSKGVVLMTTSEFLGIISLCVTFFSLGYSLGRNSKNIQK